MVERVSSFRFFVFASRLFVSSDDVFGGRCQGEKKKGKPRKKKPVDSVVCVGCGVGMYHV